MSVPGLRSRPEKRAGDAVWARRLPTGLPARWRRAVVAGGWALAAIGGFIVYFRLARTRAVNSDGASQALQAWDLLHGNVLLHGWVLSDVSFYTTEIPEYALVEIVRGLGPDVVPVAAAATYTLAVLFAAALAKGKATGRAAAVRILLAAGIMLAPQLGAGTNVLLSSPDHIGTSVPVLLTWLILDRARPRWHVPVITSVLLAWALVADELVLLIAIVPLIAVCAVRVGQGVLTRRQDATDQRGTGWRERVRARWYELALAAGAVVAGGAGEEAPRLLYAIGGYHVKPVNSGLAPAAVILRHNLAMTGRGFALLGGAYYPGLPAGGGTWFVLLHVVGVALAGCAVLVTAWRFFRGADLMSQLLVTGIVVDTAAYALGTHATILANTREIAPVLPFAAALAGRRLPGLLRGRSRVRWLTAAVLGVVLAGYLAGLGLELTARAVPPQNARLTAWLERHRLGTGLSGYWQANVVTQTSGGAAAIRTVQVYRGRLAGYAASNYQRQWYSAARSAAHFVVLAPDVPGYGGFEYREAVVAAFGAPARTYDVGPYKILWWPRNLLTRLRR
ncbi:MAG TPA: hypothetical protein VG164_05365 [Trebonia sp.]|jgi:hypothetical protein|nr:hypothetical protein [Trebonia sp.]